MLPKQVVKQTRKMYNFESVDPRNYLTYSYSYNTFRVFYQLIEAILKKSNKKTWTPSIKIVVIAIDTMVNALFNN